MEEKIRNAAEEWQTTFDSTPDIIMILDEDLKILRHNAAAMSFFGLSPQEILGRHCYDLMHKAKEPSVDCPVKRSLQLRDHQEEETYDTRRNAWYQISSDPILDTEGRVTRIVHRIKDTTKRMKAEMEARRQWEHLAHVTRMGIMGELTASLAHEINQPLTAIQSNAEAARRFMSVDEPDTGEVRQILEDISRDNRRASSIILKIRALLKKEPIPFTVLDLNELIASVLSLLRADSLLREMIIIRDFFPGLPPVFADRVQLQQVIINLILNGAAAMKHVPAAQRRLVIRTDLQKGPAVKVSVTDLGTGIDEHNTETLFEPFYTTKPDGMGMGLAISQTIIREHGGTIGASNHSEGGAVFAFTLPVHRGGQA
jgi:two-component system sensor kinase FixL